MSFSFSEFLSSKEEINKIVSIKSSSASLVDAFMNIFAKNGGKIMNEALINFDSLFGAEHNETFLLSSSSFNTETEGVLKHSFFFRDVCQNRIGVAEHPKPSKATILSLGFTLVPPKFLKL